MSTLSKVKKLSREKIFDTINEAGLKEYGIYGKPLVESWQLSLDELEENTNGIRLIVALDNSDYNGVLLEILRHDPTGIFEGARIAAYALDVEGITIHIPEYANEMAGSIAESAKEYGIDICIGMVDVRKERNNIINHIITMKELSDCFNDRYEKGVYVSINGADIVKINPDVIVKELIADIDYKAVEIGYNLLNKDKLEIPIKEIEITNGLIRTYTDADCIVYQSKQNIYKHRRESCGKCVFCREALIQLDEMINDITIGKGDMRYLQLIQEISEPMTYSTLCSIGKKSSEFTRNALDEFIKEFELHINKKQCEPNICSALMNIYIDPHKCNGCQECIDVCPEDCIDGKDGFIHMIDDFDCSKCGKCIEVCEEEAIIQTSGRLPKLPNRLIKVGRFKKR